MPDPALAEPTISNAAIDLGIGNDSPPPRPGMSISPGLQVVENSPVPGTDRSHVIGPQQAAADPVLAGLDTSHVPMTRQENRVITRTDGTSVPALPDSASAALPGPAGVTAPPAENAAALAAPATPTAPEVGTQALLAIGDQISPPG